MQVVVTLLTPGAYFGEKSLSAKWAKAAAKGGAPYRRPATCMARHGSVSCLVLARKTFLQLQRCVPDKC